MHFFIKKGLTLVWGGYINPLTDGDNVAHKSDRDKV